MPPAHHDHGITIIPPGRGLGAVSLDSRIRQRIGGAEESIQAHTAQQPPAFV